MTYHSLLSPCDKNRHALGGKCWSVKRWSQLSSSWFYGARIQEQEVFVDGSRCNSIGDVVMPINMENEADGELTFSNLQVIVSRVLCARLHVIPH